MDDLLRSAATLGGEIAKHPRVLGLIRARNAISADAEAQRLVREQAEALQRIAQLRQQQKPIEPDDKRKLAECEAAMAAHPLFKELLRAQTDYIDLMNQVNRAMETPLIAATEGEGAER